MDTLMNNKIIEARITEFPTDMFGPLPEVSVKVEGQEEEAILFSYYPDEISFKSDEFWEVHTNYREANFKHAKGKIKTKPEADKIINKIKDKNLVVTKIKDRMLKVQDLLYNTGEKALL